MGSMLRRDLHRAALALALGHWGLTRPLQAQAWPGPLRWKSQPFSLGVASGAPRPDAVLLWTRVAPDLTQDSWLDPQQTLPLQYELFSDSGLRQQVRQGEVLVHAAQAWSAHVPIGGLQAGRSYWYRFRCGDAVSMVGSTRTAPPVQADVRQLRIALASCQHWEQGQFAAHREMAAQSLDFVLFVGDYIYETSSASYTIRRHGSPAPESLADYRQRHALYKSDPALQANHAAHPWVLMWDDHEVVNDYANDHDPAYTEAAVFLKRRAAAYQAYFEHMPVWLGPDAATGGASMRLYDQMVWGQLAELWTLDCRQYRHPQACRDPYKGGGRVVTGCDELADPARSMLGLSQEQWLTQGLVRSQRQWKIVAQATQISSTVLNAPLPGAAKAVYTDAWDGYPEARRRLLQTVADAGLQNVLVLGGDVHQNVAANLRLIPDDPHSPIVASEIVGTSITSRGMGENLLARIRAEHPDIVHARSDERGYTRLLVTPQELQCEFRTTAHPVRSADAPLSTQAQVRIEAGRPGIAKL
jgi:alkaline phosphatase D